VLEFKSQVGFWKILFSPKNKFEKILHVLYDLILKHVVMPLFIYCNVSANLKLWLAARYLHLIFEKYLTLTVIDRSIVLLDSDVK